jgi:hypothetical protein
MLMPMPTPISMQMSTPQPIPMPQPTAQVFTRPPTIDMNALANTTDKEQRKNMVGNAIFQFVAS